MNATEVTLVQLSRTGDSAAFMELIHRYRDKLHMLAYRMLHNQHDSEDIVQETFVRVYLNLNQYDEKQQFSTWIYRIGKNLCIDLLRKKKDVHSLDTGFNNDQERTFYDKLKSDEISPESRVLSNEFQDQLRKVIDKMSEKYRTIVTLYYLNELTLEEISEQLGLPVTTVKTRLYRGREQLRKKWGVTAAVGLTMVLFSMLFQMNLDGGMVKA
ncbi:RNA polymerase sigma factor SigW [Paenibacillus hodogayensis]|uniref:RNA polymerase sigma factor n=1 Tax=Paenibacillus hodogayensis TaxID=279208 RepID=A0ABV5W5K0_9BACL